MKKQLLLFVCLLIAPLAVYGQFVINNFDAVPDTSYWDVDAAGENNTYLNLSLETANIHGGTGALRIDWQNECYNQWGGWIGMTHMHPEPLGLYDFSMYTHISMWYNVLIKQSKPGKVHWRIILLEAGSGTIPGSTTTGDYELWFSHYYYLDQDPGWKQIYVEMTDVGMESDQAFWSPGWGQNVDGNAVFELDKIHGWRLEFSQDPSLWQMEDDTVSGVFLIDDFELQGAAPLNLVFFNGKAVPGNVSMFVGWSGSAEVTNEEAYTPGTNSIKWTCGSGWDGLNFMFDNPKNMIFNWEKDSVQFKIKAPAGLGDINLVFHDTDDDGAVKVDYPFQAAYLLSEANMGWDGTWKSVKVALADFNRYNGCWDNDLGQNVAGEFDFTKLKQFTIGGFGQAFEGKVVYLDDIWTGNPEFDWTPPAAVAGVNAVPAEYYNLVIWQDVPGEVGETYNVYAGVEPITDLNAPGIELVAEKVVENTQTAVHWIYYPLVDTEVQYYYAVECADAAGNIGPLGCSSVITNTAKGVPTISLNPPANFAADGDLSEWDASGIMPWVITPETDNVAYGIVDDSDDLTATVYLAMDADNLYVAIDVIDNVFAYSTTGNWYDWDAFDFHIGLYDWRTPARHLSLQRGAEPDYKLIFLQDKLMNDLNSAATIFLCGCANYHFEELGGADYVSEAKIPFNMIAFGNDVIFHPARGMRIPFEPYFHDNDGAGWEGNLGYSPFNTDLAWSTCREWTYTWIGDTTYTTKVENADPIVISNYSLSQNYPNPFNPRTTIDYSVADDGLVKIEVFNTVGQRIITLVDEFKSAGSYTIDFDASDLTSGIYFYKIQAGNFTRTMKMILMK